jgi:hypothetical protein
MPLSEESHVERIALRHSVSPDAVRTTLRALRSSGGSMAQFSHPEFGGMSQWSPGMTMVGDIFNNQLKSKLDAVCSELARYATETSGDGPRNDRDAAIEVIYRKAPQGISWWPVGLGTPLRYAVFPRRLAIKDSEQIDIYDTGNHRISGVAQAQSTDQALTFTSQDGLVRVKDLPKVAQ